VWGRLELKLAAMPTIAAAELPLQVLRLHVTESPALRRGAAARLVSALARRQTLRVLHVNLPLPTQQAALQTLAEYTELEEVAVGLVVDPLVAQRYHPGPVWDFPGWPKLRKFAQFPPLTRYAWGDTLPPEAWKRFEINFLSVRRSLSPPLVSRCHAQRLAAAVAPRLLSLHVVDLLPGAIGAVAPRAAAFGDVTLVDGGVFGKLQPLLSSAQTLTMRQPTAHAVCEALRLANQVRAHGPVARAADLLQQVATTVADGACADARVRGPGKHLELTLQVPYMVRTEVVGAVAAEMGQLQAAMGGARVSVVLQYEQLSGSDEATFNATFEAAGMDPDRDVRHVDVHAAGEDPFAGPRFDEW